MTPIRTLAVVAAHRFSLRPLPPSCSFRASLSMLAATHKPEGPSLEATMTAFYERMLFAKDAHLFNVTSHYIGILSEKDDRLSSEAAFYRDLLSAKDVQLSKEAALYKNLLSEREAAYHSKVEHMSIEFNTEHAASNHARDVASGIVNARDTFQVVVQSLVEKAGLLASASISESLKFAFSLARVLRLCDSAGAPTGHRAHCFLQNIILVHAR